MARTGMWDLQTAAAPAPEAADEALRQQDAHSIALYDTALDALVDAQRDSALRALVAAAAGTDAARIMSDMDEAYNLLQPFGLTDDHTTLAADQQHLAAALDGALALLAEARKLEDEDRDEQ